ncbi:MAG: hypothetical protein Q7Q71_10250 [Verrucomicrobiota bacterium JB023]|nr:hypothetical protein [Verrucomicrobiota bacterium JB023]
MKAYLIASLLILGVAPIAIADEDRDKLLAQLDALDPLIAAQEQPVVTARLELPKSLPVVGHPYELVIKATNKSDATVWVPYNYRGDEGGWIWSDVGLKVGPDSGVKRTSVYTNPPTMGSIPAGETKVFRLTWTPSRHEVGSRQISLLLPSSFVPIAPVPIRVVPPAAPTGQNQKGEQDGADQPATDPESKPEGNQKPQPESEVRLPVAGGRPSTLSKE